MTVASRAFDALAQRHLQDFETIAKELKEEQVAEFTSRLRDELRLAALLHDVGHSIHSHASEYVYSELPLMQEAVTELRRFVGSKKGAGEVISFCFSMTPALRGMVARADANLSERNRRYVKKIDWDNVSLLIVGRSKHPYLQFMADIISSDLDADKLDYLVRDAAAAGLPLRYDLDRYLYTVSVAKDKLPDGDEYLQKLYQSIGSPAEARRGANIAYPYFDTYRLRLPRQAINTIEQIVICKFMLFSYIYHHQKVRAAEGMLGHLLEQQVRNWRTSGKSDEAILEEFLDLGDWCLQSPAFKGSDDASIADYSKRICERLLPREVYGFVASKFSHAEGGLLSEFITVLLDKNPPKKGLSKRNETISRFHRVLGENLVRLYPDSWKTPEEALRKAGAWLDAPKPPKFENINLLVGSLADAVPLSEVFPVQFWIQAYESHRYCVRIFAFSEYAKQVREAARSACEEVIGPTTDSFYQAAERTRT
jgi:HD superfamily phosphohydrolase